MLYGSYTQTQALSLAVAQAVSMLDVHARLIRRLEQVGGLDREIEFLPSEKAIAERARPCAGSSPRAGHADGLRQDLLYSELVESDLPEDPYLDGDLERYFPAPLPERFAEHMRHHRLRRELIATVVPSLSLEEYRSWRCSRGSRFHGRASGPGDRDRRAPMEPRPAE